jgi:hypothetical protein
MISRINILSFFFLIFVGSFVNGQNFKSSVDKTTVAQNERFQVYFTFEGEDVNKLSGFQPPEFNNFRVLSGPNRSTSMQIINGKMSASLTYSYIVHPKALGEFTIGSALVKYEGKSYKTEPLKIKVVKADESQSAQNKNDAGISEQELRENLFIRAIPDKNTVYKGEQINVTYKLYTRLNISSPQISQLPTYKGFWSEEFETNQNIQFNVEMYDGKRFRTAEIKKVALFPTNTGKLTITPFELKVPVIVQKKRSNRNDFFDDFFNDSFFGRTQTIEKNIASNSITVNVKDLPAADKPESFGGAVGDFDFNVDIENTDLEVNESTTLTVKVSGRGNIKLIDMPKLNVGAGIEVYDPKTDDKVNQGIRISGTKTAEYLMIPRVPGTKVIDPIEFSYFDPDKEKYFSKKSPSFTLNVAEGEGTVSQPTAGVSKKDVQLLSKDIRFIKTSSFNLSKQKDSAAVKTWFYYALVLPLFILIGLVAVQKRREKLSADVQGMRYRKAEKIAKSRLKTAKKHLNSDDLKEFFNELSQALFGYLEYKLNLQTADFTIDNALELLKSKNIDDEIIKQIREISDKCEFARFAPSQMGKEDAEKLYSQAVETIIKVENLLAGKKKK